MKTSEHRRWWALIALVPAVLAVALDGTVLSVALPTLSRDLHATTDQLQWFVVAYSLVFAAAMIPGGMLGDRYGRKRMLLISLAIFGAGSVACAFAPTAGWFIAARALLGLGAAVILPMALAALPVLFTEQERPKAIAVVMTVTMLGFPIGPILGGWLLTSYWWGWVFSMNLPVVAIGMTAVAVLVPESRAAERPGLDPVGIVASCAGLAVLVYGFIAAGQYGWTSVTAIAAMTAGAVILAAFVAWERRLTRRPGGQPLVDLTLFKSPRFTWGTILQAFGVFAMFGLLFAAPQFFQAILGVSAMGSGLRLLPLMAGLALGAIVADRAATRLTSKLTAALGFTLLTAGLALGTTMTVSSGNAFIAAWTAIAGAGFGLALATAASSALVDLPKASAGVGSAVMQAVQKAGAPLSAAILGSVLASAYHSGLSLAGLPPHAAGAVRSSVFAGLAVAHQLGSAQLLDSVRAAFTHGIDAMLWASAGLAVAGIVATLAFLPWHATAGPEPVAATGPGSDGAESLHERIA